VVMKVKVVTLGKGKTMVVAVAAVTGSGGWG
jgi:hypothetical protein